MKYLFGFLISFFAVTSSADVYQVGPIKVKSMRIAKNGIYVSFSPALTACQGGDQYRMHALAPVTQGNYQVLSSALIAAYVAQIDLHYVFVSNEGTECSASHILNLDMIEYGNK